MTPRSLAFVAVAAAHPIPPLYKSIDRGATWTWTGLSTTRLWGRNLGDEQLKVYGSNSLVVLGDPRTFGGTVSTQLWRTR